MKKYFLISIVIFSLNIITANPNHEVLLYSAYDDLPFSLEIKNSGIYSIASFDVAGDTIEFSSFNSFGTFKFYSNKLIRKTNSQSIGKDFLAKINTKNISNLNKSSNYYPDTENRLFRKNYFNKTSYLVDNNGVLTGLENELLLVNVESRERLIIESENLNLTSNITIEFPNNLACADLIGIDASGNIFLVIEKYLREFPLKVRREVYTLSNNGEVLSILELPNIKYLTTLKDLQIDESGHLFHLVSDKEGIKIIKWSDLITKTQNTIYYPSNFNYEIHFNNYVSIDEAELSLLGKTENLEELAGRSEALKIAETYALHQYSCTSNNLAPSNTTAPDGDIVRTPNWLVVGMNARIPYKWGGFNTITQFDAALQSGRYAGDINTSGVSSYAVGVDCSGYVSRCWQMSYHASTAYMPNITTQYADWDDLKPGDAIHKVGHVRLFVERNINGSFKIVEAAGRNWDVSYYSYTASDLSTYTARYYNNMVDNFNAQRPVLTSASIKSDSLITLTWDCDTSGILGFRVYQSIDGENWSLVIDEIGCQTTNVQIQHNDGAKYFRVASVKNDSPNLSESNWSNVLGTGNFSSEKKCLVVDGFTRESGSWRGAGHTFALKYGKAFEALSLDFTTIRNSEMVTSSYNLNDYDFIFWILGDESTADETFSHDEQQLVGTYLENGGNLFVSGSEVGWDLDYKGDSQDKNFYSNYLKANYLSDDALSNNAVGLINTSMDGCSLFFGQTYDEDYPDEIEAINGSIVCMKYNNNKNAGVQYSGPFGSSAESGKLIYLAFPLETTADNSSFNQIISGAYDFFNTAVSVKNSEPELNLDYRLEQNYPNPFNPSTTISYQIPDQARNDNVFVQLTVHDILGREVAKLVNKEQGAGSYQVQFNASNLTSGIYFYKIISENFIAVKKMTIIK